MPSPALETAAKSIRTEANARAAWREACIQRQLSGLRVLGLDAAALTREEALLRGGFAARDIAAALVEKPAP